MGSAILGPIGFDWVRKELTSAGQSSLGFDFKSLP